VKISEKWAGECVFAEGGGVKLRLHKERRRRKAAPTPQDRGVQEQCAKRWRREATLARKFGWYCIDTLGETCYFSTGRKLFWQNHLRMV